MLNCHLSGWKAFEFFFFIIKNCNIRCEQHLFLFWCNIVTPSFLLLSWWVVCVCVCGICAMDFLYFSVLLNSGFPPFSVCYPLLVVFSIQLIEYRKEGWICWEFLSCRESSKQIAVLALCKLVVGRQECGCKRQKKMTINASWNVITWIAGFKKTTFYIFSLLEGPT